ncbi:MAG: hypothetical protein HZB16_19975 [Armatimonadetes bacterium]|nr:hypothetical protein [Armatimonadota bacterium]
MLDLDDLAAGMPAVTPELGVALAQAGAVCLELEGHQQGALVSVAGALAAAHELRWSPMTPQMARSYNEETRATDLGAVGLALLLMRDITGLTAVSQSRLGTGFDYWLGDDVVGDLPLAGQVRLEVSGIRHGAAHDVTRRVREKLAQTHGSDGTRKPAYAVVVEFSAPLAKVALR